MQWLRAVWREIYGLFVDDGSFAVGLVAWMVIAGGALRQLHGGHWGGVVLFVGLAGVLGENALRSAKSKSSRRRD